MKETKQNKKAWKIVELSFDITYNFYRLMLLNKKVTYSPAYNAKIKINKININILVIPKIKQLFFCITFKFILQIQIMYYLFC